MSRSIPISILIGSIILGGFYYESEIKKQESVERQQQVEMGIEQTNFQAKINQQESLNRCIDGAYTEYTLRLESQGYEPVNLNTGYYNTNIPYYIDEMAKQERQTAIDNCIKEYPQN